MRLLRAEFRNFRLIRDLAIEFGSDGERKLTVIRAANESGKTTVLHALRWALYGDVALPNKGQGFRLHPIDWNVDDGKQVRVSVTVDFEQTSYRPVSGGRVQATSERFRLVRSVTEHVDRENARASSTVELYKLGPGGVSAMKSPEAVLNEAVPCDLRDVFFTDGDRALSFIEADAAVATKRHRVEKAIRSLLGLGVIEDAIRHVRTARREVNRKAKNLGSGHELAAIVDRLQLLDRDGDLRAAQLRDSEEQFRAFDERLSDTERRIAAALREGNRANLERDLSAAKRNLGQLDSQAIAASKEHSGLFRGRDLATELVGPRVLEALDLLNDLHDQGKIPNATVPVLEDCLAARACICGESLRDDQSDGTRRRAHIEGLIDRSRRADGVQKVVTELYYSTRWLQPGTVAEEQQWLSRYEEVMGRREGIQDMKDTEGRKQRVLELELDSVKDTDIKGLNETRQDYKRQRDRFLGKSASLKAELSGLRGERGRLERERDRLLRLEKRGVRVLAERDVIHDVMEVLQGAYYKITGDELGKVSLLMNGLFLEMIGSDPEHGSIIQQAMISSEFDIIVVGPKGKHLDPDRDLNGASRRALTLAFVLALTRVSEVSAPNVIDTPLGMTSGFVKRAILKTAVRESGQLILFLTHDEIMGCEELIDEMAGVVVTLTNPAHYPKILVHKPQSEVRMIVRCECDHRSSCSTCERRSDVKNRPAKKVRRRDD